MRRLASLLLLLAIASAACGADDGAANSTSSTGTVAATAGSAPPTTAASAGLEQQAHDHLTAVAAGLDVGDGQQATFQQCPLLPPNDVPYDVGLVMGGFDLGGNIDPSRPAGAQVTCAMTDPANPNGASRSLAVRAAIAGSCFDDFEADYAAGLDDVSAPVAGGVVYPQLGLWCGEQVVVSWSVNVAVATDDPLLESAIEGLLQAAATFDVSGLAYEADSGSAV
ncbi:MAG: hypothetical protein Q7V88_11255 [Actinomycetota bacterium]|nr:hypothetical protein [Actinomycetota bacterium]